MIIPKKALIRLSQLQTKSKVSNYGGTYTLPELIRVASGERVSINRTPEKGLLPGKCIQEGSTSVMALAGCKLVGEIRYTKVIALVFDGRTFHIPDEFYSVPEHQVSITPTFLQDLPDRVTLNDHEYRHVTQYEPLKTLIGLLS